MEARIIYLTTIAKMRSISHLISKEVAIMQEPLQRK